MSNNAVSVSLQILFESILNYRRNVDRKVEELFSCKSNSKELRLKRTTKTLSIYASLQNGIINCINIEVNASQWETHWHIHSTDNYILASAVLRLD